MNLRNAIVVLNDGETFTSLAGAKVLILTDGGIEMLDDTTPNNLNPEEIEQAIDLESWLLRNDKERAVGGKSPV
jgi:hypothetical protein